MNKFNWMNVGPTIAILLTIAIIVSILRKILKNKSKVHYRCSSQLVYQYIFK